MLLDAGETEGVVVLLWRFARDRRLVASGGFSEWTCSIALRSLLKTPCLNLGANLWRIEWMELSSTLSTNLWNRSQSATESQGGGVGFPRDVRSRVPSTRACCGKIITARVCIRWAGGRSGRSSECGVAIDVWCSQRVYGGRTKGFKRETSVSDAPCWMERWSASTLGRCDMHKSELCSCGELKTWGLGDEWRGRLEDKGLVQSC
jgi:hypothetical protein